MIYNVLYKSFVFEKFKKNGNNIIKLINKESPDLLVLNECSPIVPNKNIGISKHFNKIKLKNYKKNVTYHAKNNNGTLIYWSNKFKKIKESKGISIFEDGIDNSYERPCIGVKLIHINSNKTFIIIGVHLDHYVNNHYYKKGIYKILKELKFNKNDNILIMGDHNEFYEMNKKNIKLNINNIKLNLISKNKKGKMYLKLAVVMKIIKNILVYINIRQI